MAITTQLVGILPLRKTFIGTQAVYSATVKLTSSKKFTTTYWTPSSAVDPAKLIAGYSGRTSGELRGEVTFSVDMSPSGTVYRNANKSSPVSAGERISAGTPVGIDRVTTITFSQV